MTWLSRHWPTIGLCLATALFGGLLYDVDKAKKDDIAIQVVFPVFMVLLTAIVTKKFEKGEKTDPEKVLEGVAKLCDDAVNRHKLDNVLRDKGYALSQLVSTTAAAIKARHDLFNRFQRKPNILRGIVTKAYTAISAELSQQDHETSESILARLDYLLTDRLPEHIREDAPYTCIEDQFDPYKSIIERIFISLATKDLAWFQPESDYEREILSDKLQEIATSFAR